MMKVTFEVVALLATLALLAGCRGLRPLHEEVRESAVAHEPGKPISVRSTNGAVRVVRENRADVAITAKLRCNTAERLAGSQVVAAHGPAGTLEVGVAWAGAKRQSREGCDFQIALPGADGVTLRSSNGALIIRGLSGPADLKTSNGSVGVEDHGGPVVAVTSNGTIDVAGVRGDVALTTKNGRIGAVGVTGAIAAATSNGAVELAMDPAGGGPVQATTSNGSIGIALAPGFRGGLDLSTSNGRVRVDPRLGAEVLKQEKTSAVLRFGGEPTPPSSARTSNGSITVRPL